MKDIVTEFGQIFCSKSISGSVSNSDPLYIGIGRVQAWPDLVTEDPINSRDYQVKIANDLYGAKKLQVADIAVGTRRINWTSGVIYDQYVSHEPMTDKDFYVVTSALNVYKCISNNSESPSTQEPTGTPTTVFGTTDGYRWKYMYSINDLVYNKFATSEYIPVTKAYAGDGSSQALVQATAKSGAIEGYRITNAGSGYTTASAQVVGNGSGAQVSVDVQGGSIQKITVVSSGANYTMADVVITGDGTGAEVVPIYSPYGGHGYDAANELDSRYILVTCQLDYDEGGKIAIDNNYRQVVIFTAKENLYAANLTTTLNVSNNVNFIDDAIVTGSVSGATGRIVQSTDNEINIVSVTGKFLNETITAGPETLAFVNSVVEPDIHPNDINILYILNNKPTSRDVIQAERIIFAFRV